MPESRLRARPDAGLTSRFAEWIPRVIPPQQGQGRDSMDCDSYSEVIVASQTESQEAQRINLGIGLKDQ